MKQILEFIPIIGFLAAFVISKDSYIATQALIGATLLQLALLKLTKNPITTMQWTVAAVACIFGGLTLGLHDERFIQIKPTIIYLISAAAFFISNHFFKKNLVQAMLGSVLNPPEAFWRKLNNSWIILFIIMAISNLALMYTLSFEQWAWSKLGFGIISVLFTMLQVLVMRHYIITPSEQTK
jgi:intracellular septation protein